MLGLSYRAAKRVVISVVGGTLVLFGLILLVLPGPGILIVLLGLTVLASEFVWARLWLRRVRVTSRRAGRRARGWWRPRARKTTEARRTQRSTEEEEEERVPPE